MTRTTVDCLFQEHSIVRFALATGNTCLLYRLLILNIFICHVSIGHTEAAMKALRMLPAKQMLSDVKELIASGVGVDLPNSDGGTLVS